MEELSRAEADKRWQQLKQVVQLLVGEFRGVPDTDYLVCAVARGRRTSEDGQMEPIRVSFLSTNLKWTDIHGNPRPPTVGVLTDLVVEAMLSPGGEFQQGSYVQGSVQQFKM